MPSNNTLETPTSSTAIPSSITMPPLPPPPYWLPPPSPYQPSQPLYQPPPSTYQRKKSTTSKCRIHCPNHHHHLRIYLLHRRMPNVSSTSTAVSPVTATIATATAVGAALDRCTASCDVDSLGMWPLSVDQLRTRWLQLQLSYESPQIWLHIFATVIRSNESGTLALNHLTEPLNLIPCSLSNVIVVSHKTLKTLTKP